MHTYVSHGGNMRWKRDRPTCCNNISKCCKLSACPIALLFSHLVRFIGNKNRNNNLFIRYERAKREEKKVHTPEKAAYTQFGPQLLHRKSNIKIPASRLSRFTFFISLNCFITATKAPFFLNDL